jgi:hypothetical protein
MLAPKSQLIANIECMFSRGGGAGEPDASRALNAAFIAGALGFDRNIV